MKSTTHRAPVDDTERLPRAPALTPAIASLRTAYSDAERLIRAARQRVKAAHEHALREAPPGRRTNLAERLSGCEVELGLLAKTARRMTDYYKPSCVCPSCDGDGCPDCGEVGWLAPVHQRGGRGAGGDE